MHAPLLLFVYIGLMSLLHAQNDNVTIWLHTSMRTDPHHVHDIRVYIDGKYKGRLMKAFDKAPECRSKNCVNLELPTGKHKIEIKGQYKGAQRHARDRKYHAGGYFSVNDQKCIKLQVFYQDNVAYDQVIPPLETENERLNLGEIVFWVVPEIRAQNLFVRNLRAYVNGTYVGNLKHAFEYSPKCADENTLTHKLKPGAYKIEITGDLPAERSIGYKRRYYYKGEAVVYLDQCTIFQIDEKGLIPDR